jgi:hypothetical protein
LRRQDKVFVWIGATLLLGTLALAGCSIPRFGGVKPIPSAATILEDAVTVQKTEIKDVEFSMVSSFTGIGLGTASGSAVSEDFTGTLTTSPQREQIFTKLTTAGMQISSEVIFDEATNTMYMKVTGSSLPGLPSGKWTKMSLGSSLDPVTIDPSQLSDLSKFKGATLKGSETLNGVHVWHLQSSATQDGLTTHADIYIRQDNNELYEMVAHVTGTLTGTTTDTSTGTMNGTVTYKVTGVNTGAKISLPPASQVTQFP